MAKKKGLMAAVRRALRVPEPSPAPLPALTDVFAPAHTLVMDDASYRTRLAASLGLAQDSAGTVAGPCLPPGISTFCAAGLASMSGFIGYPRCAELMQDGLMRRGVTVTADEMTRNFPHFIGTAGKDSAEAAMRLNDEMERLCVVERFHEMAVMCGAFGGGLLYLKRRGEDVQNLAGAISIRPEFFRDGGLEALIPVEPFSVGPLAYNSTQPLAGDYFRPSSWFVAGAGEVSASRFLHFSTGELPVILRPAYNFFGVPSVQLALDYLLHFTEDRESAGRLLKKFSLTIFKTNADELLYGDDDSQVARRIRVLAQQRDNDGVFAISQEDEEMVQINTPLSGVTDIVRQALEMLAVVWGIPIVKFLGVSPGGMNATGESDLRSFYDHVESQRQKMFAHNFDMLARAMQFSLFGALREDMTWTWPSLWEITERERAEIAKQEADADAIYLDRGILSQEEVRAALSGDEEGRFAGIDPEEVPEAEGGGGAAISGMEAAPGGHDGPGAPGDGDGADKAGAVYDAALLGLDPSRAWLFWRAEDAGFDDGKHPREDNSQFAQTGSGASSGPQDITDLLGEEIKGVKGDDALEALLEKEGGHVKGAYYRRETGPIDLFWGDDSCGLKHIIKRRLEEGDDLEGLLTNLSSVIATGRVKRDYAHENGPEDKKWLITKGPYRVSVSAMLRGNKLTHVLTAFED